MKQLVKIGSRFLVACIILLVGQAAIAGGNGNGTEPPDEDKAKSTEQQKAEQSLLDAFCEALPLVCESVDLSGNGNGTEPPE